ncbi:MAG: hypothetical protein JXD23_14550 [Spirochaetales bacterium]|nr:hypothetical protein [Spirochaetales bacterium]
MRRIYRILLTALLAACFVSCSDMIARFRTVDPGPLDCLFILDLSGSMTVNMNAVDGASARRGLFLPDGGHQWAHECRGRQEFGPIVYGRFYYQGVFFP